jgi:hypothetical protein
LMIGHLIIFPCSMVWSPLKVHDFHLLARGS